jgi:hypothetical protein
VETLRFAELAAEIDRDAGGALRVRFSGRSTSREAGKTLAPLFDRLIADAKSESCILALHFERLEYFNSSTSAALAQFIRAANQAGVPLDLAYDSEQRWQAVSFEALRHALRPFESGPGNRVRFLDE